MKCIHHTWDISRKTCNNIVKNLILNRGSVVRKVRKDKGNSTFVCEKKRKAVFTAFNCYLKKRHRDYREDIDLLT